MSRSRVLMAVAALSLGALLIGSIPADAKPSHAARVTNGTIANLASGTSRGFHLGGHARMVRTGNDKTIVSVHVTGLVDGNAYAVHVHNTACSAGEGGGHYTFPTAVTGGQGPAHNEIWPGPVTANGGGGVANGRTKVGARAGATAVSVVVHDTDGTKIGCADLS